MGNSSLAAIVLEMGEVQTLARSLGFDVAAVEIRRAQDIAPAVEALKDRADALYVASDPLVVGNQIRINTFALAARLPTMSTIRDQIEAGGLMSYGPNIPDQFRRAADYVDKILHGTANEVRSRPKSNHSEGPWPHNASVAARARRRGDRIAEGASEAGAISR
jgi:putative ABC transport system substrate-binding protein